MKDIADNSFVPTDIPDGCTRIHLNLVVILLLALCLLLFQLCNSVVAN